MRVHQYSLGLTATSPGNPLLPSLPELMSRKAGSFCAVGLLVPQQHPPGQGSGKSATPVQIDDKFHCDHFRIL